MFAHSCDITVCKQWLTPLCIWALGQLGTWQFDFNILTSITSCQHLSSFDPSFCNTSVNNASRKMHIRFHMMIKDFWKIVVKCVNWQINWTRGNICFWSSLPSGDKDEIMTLCQILEPEWDFLVPPFLAAQWAFEQSTLSSQQQRAMDNLCYIVLDEIDTSKLLLWFSLPFYVSPWF